MLNLIGEERGPEQVGYSKFGVVGGPPGGSKILNLRSKISDLRSKYTVSGDDGKSAISASEVAMNKRSFKRGGLEGVAAGLVA